MLLCTPVFCTRNARAEWEHPIFHLKMSSSAIGNVFPSALKVPPLKKRKSTPEYSTWIWTGTWDHRHTQRHVYGFANWGLILVFAHFLSLPPPLFIAITHLGPRIKLLSPSSKIFITPFNYFQVLKHFLLHFTTACLSWSCGPSPGPPEQHCPIGASWRSTVSPVGAIRAEAIPWDGRAHPFPPACSPACPCPWQKIRRCAERATNQCLLPWVPMGANVCAVHVLNSRKSRDCHHRSQFTPVTAVVPGQHPPLHPQLFFFRPFCTNSGALNLTSLMLMELFICNHWENFSCLFLLP